MFSCQWEPCLAYVIWTYKPIMADRSWARARIRSPPSDVDVFLEVVP